ncbi:MAG: NADH:ubiquinone oxidoreductase [Chloroflexi bacterium]|nr:NADH:ubiquinone oxidoreductase [Chloroflexota bacterium]
MEFLTVHSPALVVAVPLLAAFITPLISRIGNKFRDTVNVTFLSFAAFLMAVLAVDIYTSGTRIYTFGATVPELAIPEHYMVPVRIIFQVDGISIFMGLTTTVVALAALVYSLQFVKDETGQDRFYSLFMILYVGMVGLEFTGDMFNMFVFLEILSIAGAGLASYRVNLADAVEGGFKYIVISAISALLVLFAIGILYGEYNLLSIAALAHNMQFTTLDMIALALLGIAFVMKLAGVPLHMWAPDTYAVAPAGITPMIYTSSAASMYALYRITFTLYGGHFDTTAIGWIVIILGVLSMFIGVMMAIHQTDIKRLMAYHAISQSGYMLLGVGVGLAVLTDPVALAAYGRDAMNGGIFHIINNALYKGMLFLTAEAIFFRIGTRDLNRMGGLGHNMKWTTIFFIIGALAISGIPPFNGFASKLLIYESVFRFNPLLSVIAMFVSLVTLASFTKVFYSAFTGPEMSAYKEVREVPKSMLIGMGVMAAAIIFFSIFPGLVVNTIVAPATNALIDQASYINGVMGAVP